MKCGADVFLHLFCHIIGCKIETGVIILCISLLHIEIVGPLGPVATAAKDHHYQVLLLLLILLDGYLRIDDILCGNGESHLGTVVVQILIIMEETGGVRRVGKAQLFIGSPDVIFAAHISI